jgi:hypothetical protein
MARFAVAIMLEDHRRGQRAERLKIWSGDSFLHAAAVRDFLRLAGKDILRTLGGNPKARQAEAGADPAETEAGADPGRALRVAVRALELVQMAADRADLETVKATAAEALAGLPKITR